MNWKNRLHKYLANLDKATSQELGKRKLMHRQISKHNADLIRNYIEQLKGLPSQPVDRGLYISAIRMKSAILAMNDKPLDKITEKDLITLNQSMREKGMNSANDIRQELRRFFTLLDEKKYFDTIRSPYLKNARAKKNKKVVDSSKFWNEQECKDYIEESLRHSPEQGCIATLFISSGCRPHEILQMKKENIDYDGTYLTIRVPENTKTGSRVVVLEGAEARGVWTFIKDHIESLEPGQPITVLQYSGFYARHRNIIKTIRLPAHKYPNPYAFRKLRLTRFYSEKNMGQATSLVGHQPGSPVMRHYVSVNEAQLKGKGLFSIKAKACPNPSCSYENQPFAEVCADCGSPLNEDNFKKVFDERASDLIESQIDLIKEKLKAEMLEKALMERR